MSVLMSCSFLSVPLVFAGLILWRVIVMALVVVCFPNPLNCDAPSLTTPFRPISLSSCLRRLQGAPPVPPHRLRWPLERPILLDIHPHTYHNLHAVLSCEIQELIVRGSSDSKSGLRDLHGYLLLSRCSHIQAEFCPCDQESACLHHSCHQLFASLK